MNTILNYVGNNPWLFSGIGTYIISLIVFLIIGLIWGNRSYVKPIISWDQSNTRHSIIVLFTLLFLLAIFSYINVIKEDSIREIEPYIVFSDSSFASGNVWYWSGAKDGKDHSSWKPNVIETPYEPRGKVYYGLQSGSGDDYYFGWGIYLGLFINDWRIKTQTVDLSDYDCLEFWVKTPIDLAVYVNIWDYDESEDLVSSEVLISNHNWNSNKPNEWQKITIPKSKFGYINWTAICAPFIIGGKGNDIIIYVDEVIWKSN